ncbi:MAG: citramalate synthase, partial [Clostridia bacterium]|nr:citramalate synthase [Clostridia bacterium]
YSFEGAEASLQLRLLGMLGRRRHFFELQDFHVISRQPENELNAQAYVKVRVDGQVEITADEGDGPVNAIDLAVRKALSRFYPCLGRMRLKDFKVRVVNMNGTASRVRVGMETTDGVHVWSTVGVSSNVIEASVIALTDSVEFMLLGETEGWR